MAARTQEPRHQDHDVPPPEGVEDDGETATAEDQSPIATEPPPARKAPPRKAKGKATRIVREYQETVPEGHVGEDAEFVDESPLSAMAEATLADCHVFRDGPGTGPGWVGGMWFDDGRGARPVSKGPAGTYQKTANLLEVIANAVGGGHYKVISKGQVPVPVDIPGPPLPLPAEAPNGAQQGYPNGARPNWHGGFEQGPFDPFGFDHSQPQVPQDPFQPDANGFVVPVEQVQAQGGVSGWVWLHTVNQWKWFGPGLQPSQPPPLPGSTGNSGPNPFDHRLAAKPDDETTTLLKALLVKLDKPAADPMAGFGALMQNQIAADRLRWEQQRADDDRKAAAVQAEAQRRFDADQAQRQNEFKLMLAKIAKDDASATARASNEVQIAQIQAGSAKDVATAAAAQAKEIAALHAASSAQMIALVTANASKTDPMALFKQGVELAADIAGGREDNLAGQIADAGEKIITAGSAAAKDVMTTIHMNRPATPPAPAPGAPPAPGGPPHVAMTPEQQTNAQVTAANLQLVGYLVQNWSMGVKPTIAVVRSGAIAYGLVNSYPDILKRIDMATPEIVVAQFKAGVQALGNPQMFAVQVPAVEAMATHPGDNTRPSGRAWLDGLKLSIRQAAQAPAQVPGPPPAALPPAPPPAAIGTTLAPAAAQPPPSGLTAEQRLAQEQSRAAFGAPAVPPPPPKTGTTLS